MDQHVQDVAFGVHASAVRLDSLWVLSIAAVVAVGTVVLVPWRWDAWRRRRLGRSATVLLAVVAVVLGCGLVVNRMGEFYPTLGSLLGSSPNPAEGTEADGADMDHAMDVVAARGAHGEGTLVHVTVNGRRTRIDRDLDVYFPPGYTARAWAGFRFPVIEWIPHFPGEPRAFAVEYGMPAMLDAAIDSLRMPPTVVIVPDSNGEPRLTHDSECVDAVGGAPNDTYLSADVRHLATHTLRVRADRAGWAIAGWSSGGYCAMDLATRHPQWYSVAVSMSGYDRTPQDAVTGDLFHGRVDVRDANDVSTTLRRHPSPVRILACADGAADDEQAALDRLRAAVTPPDQLTTWVFPPAGHNLAAVRAELPSVLDWLAAAMGDPVETSSPGPARRTEQSTQAWTLPDTGTPGALHGADAQN
jgi:enterochelin esterase-like enzyme